MRILKKFRSWEFLIISLFVFSLFFASCEDSTNSKDTTVSENPVNSEDRIGHIEGYDVRSSFVSGGFRIPPIERIELEKGKGFCDVTIYGKLSASGSVVDVQIMVLHDDIIMVPIVKPGLSGTNIVTPFTGAKNGFIDKRGYYMRC